MWWPIRSCFYTLCLLVSLKSQIFALKGAKGNDDQTASILELLHDHVHTFQSDSLTHINKLHIVGPNDNVDVRMFGMHTRQLGATITPVVYGENYEQTDTYPHSFSTSLVLASGTEVSFTDISFSDSCTTIGQTDNVDFASGCAIIVPYNASLILPDTFILDKGCIRVLGGALFGAKNLTLSHGAKLEIQMDSIWVGDVRGTYLSGAKDDTVEDKNYDFTDNAVAGQYPFIYNTTYRGKFDTDSLTLLHGSGVYITGGDSVAYQEAQQQWSLVNLHILDDESFISTDGGGYSANGPQPLTSQQPSSTQSNHKSNNIEYNPNVNTDYSHATSEKWFGAGGTHAGMGGSIIGLEFDTAPSSAYSATTDITLDEEQDYNPDNNEDNVHLTRSATSSAISYDACTNSNKRTCSARIVGSRGNAMRPMYWGGSGGSAVSVVGGNGGGHLRLIVSRILENHGLITANGHSCEGDWGHGGGGAGGSIWISVTNGGLFGTGTIRAQGGHGCARGGGGGSGGRVAVHTRYPTQCTWNGDISVDSGSQKQYHSKAMDEFTHENDHYIPYPRYPAGGTVYLADEQGENGEMLATNNGVGGADITLFAEEIDATANYTLFNIKTLLLHDTGIHTYTHKDAGRWNSVTDSHGGKGILTLTNLATLKAAAAGNTQVAGKSISGRNFGPYSAGDAEITYAQQVQTLYTDTCPVGSTACGDCIVSTAVPSTTNSIWTSLLNQMHRDSLGGESFAERGKLFVTNNSLVVLASQLHVEDYSVQVVNSTLFVQSSVTILRNSSLEISSYTATDADYGTTRPGYSRGCVNAIRSTAVLNNIGEYFTNSYLTRSNLVGPRGGIRTGSKEADFFFYKSLSLNTTREDSNADIQYYESYFADDPSATLPIDSDPSDGYTETSFPDMACLSFGDLLIDFGGKLRILPTETPAFMTNYSTGKVKNDADTASSTSEFLATFNSGVEANVNNFNYSDILLQRSLTLQQKAGASVLLVARTAVIESGGIIQASGVHTSKHKNWMPLSPDGETVEYAGYDSYATQGASGTFEGTTTSDLDTGEHLDVRRLAKITTDGHGQASDGKSGGGGGGNAGTGTPAVLSPSIESLETAWGTSGISSHVSGGFGGRFRDIGSIMMPFGAGGPGGAGLRQAGGSGGAGLTILFQHFFVNEGSISADGVSGDTSNLESYGVGGGAGGSILIYSTNGTMTGDGLITARGAHAALGGGAGSGGRISVDSCTDSFTGTFDVRGGVAMLPLRQVQLLHNIASFVVSSSVSKAYPNVTSENSDTYPYTAGYFSDSAADMAAAAAGTGSRILRTKRVDDAMPVLISASSGTVGLYSSWDTSSEPDSTYTSRCVTAQHRNRRSLKVSVPSTWTVQEFFNFSNPRAYLPIYGTSGSAYVVGDQTLSAMSSQLLSGWTGRGRQHSDTAHYANFWDVSFSDGANGVSSGSKKTAGINKYEVPFLLPNIIPALDTIVDFPIMYVNQHATFVGTTSAQGGETLSGTRLGFADDNYDDILNELKVLAGSHVTLAATRVNQLDLAIKSLNVDSAASVLFPESIRFRGDDAGVIDLNKGTFFNRGSFRSARSALSMDLTLRNGAKLVLHAPLSYHKLLASVKVDGGFNETQEIKDLVEDFDFESPPGEDYATEILGLQDNEVGASVLESLLYNGANISTTQAYFTSLQSIPTHNFANINLTDNSAIIGPVILIRADRVSLHNSAISADSLGFYGGDNGDNPDVYYNRNQPERVYTDTDTGLNAGSATGNGFAGGFSGDNGGDGGGHGGSSTYGRSSMFRHRLSEELLGVADITVSIEQSVVPLTTLLKPNVDNGIGIEYVQSTDDTYANAARSRGYGSPYAPILPGSGGGASSGDGSVSNGGSDIGGRGGGVIVIALTDYLNLRDTCPGGICANKNSMDEWDMDDVSLRSSLAHWTTRISADGESTFGGGGGGAGGSVWLRYNGGSATVASLQGNGLISARGGQTCFFPEGSSIACVAQAEEQSPFDIRQGYNTSVNQSREFGYMGTYNILDYPGGPGAGGRVRLEINTTHTIVGNSFTGAVSASAGYSHHSAAASIYLGGHRGTIVNIPDFIQYYYEPSKNYKPRDLDANTEYGIDIRTDTNFAAPLFAVQVIDVTGFGKALGSNGIIVGGTWRVSYKGYTNGAVILKATATATEVYNALASIPNSDLRHINVVRSTLGNFNANTYATNSSELFNGGYRYKITFCEDQESLSLIKVVPGTAHLYTIPVNNANISISLEAPPTTSADIRANINAYAVEGDYVPDGITSYHGRWAAHEIKKLVDINRDILGATSYAYWRDKNTLRVVPGGHGLSVWDLRNLIYEGFKIHRLTPISTMLGRLLSLNTETLKMPTPAPTGQPSMQPSGQPSSQPTRQPSGQPTSQPTMQPTSQPSGRPTSQPTGQPSRQPSSQPTMQPSGQPSAQPSGQPSIQPSMQPSAQPSGKPSGQPTSQPSMQPSGQPSSQPTMQPSNQPTGSPSCQPSAHPSSQPSRQPSSQPSMQPSSLPSARPSGQPSGMPSARPSTQPSGQPSARPSSQPSRVPSSQPSGQPSGQPSNQPTSKPSGQPSNQPTSNPSGQPSSLPSAQPSGVPSSQPSTRPSSEPSGVPSSQPSGIPSGQPSASPSGIPASRPTGQPSSEPSAQPSGFPSSQPTGFPSGHPSSLPSAQPSVVPSSQPSARPSSQPSSEPSGKPSSQPSGKPSMQPSGKPSSQPSSEPSAQPSNNPTGQPTSFPTSPSGRPTGQPSSTPTSQPSGKPSGQPSERPSAQPSGRPTAQPSGHPTAQPSRHPSGKPSSQPSSEPSAQPSNNPTGQPTSFPTSPSGRPTGQPSSTPTSQPSGKPSAQPSGVPSAQPSGKPSSEPSGRPTAQPSGKPSSQPSSEPSAQPSNNPTGQPSGKPSGQPSGKPTGQPSRHPTSQPSSLPTCPTGKPTGQPSNKPTGQPSGKPTLV